MIFVVIDRRGLQHFMIVIHVVKFKGSAYFDLEVFKL